MDTQEIEDLIIRRLAIDVFAAGYQISINDGEEWCLKHSTSIDEVMGAIRSTDSDTFAVVTADRKCIGTVFLVYGNDGHDVFDACDGGEELKRLLNGADALANQISEWQGEPFLLLKRGLYWRPDAAGYTGLKREARRYEIRDAISRCYGGDPAVTMISEAKAPRFSPGCSQDVKDREMELVVQKAADLVRHSIKCEEDRRKKLKDGSVAAGFCDGRLEKLKASLAELEGS